MVTRELRLTIREGMIFKSRSAGFPNLFAGLACMGAATLSGIKYLDVWSRTLAYMTAAPWLIESSSRGQPAPRTAAPRTAAPRSARDTYTWRQATRGNTVYTRPENCAHARARALVSMPTTCAQHALGRARMRGVTSRPTPRRARPNYAQALAYPPCSVVRKYTYDIPRGAS